MYNIYNIKNYILFKEIDIIDIKAGEDFNSEVSNS